MAVSKPAIKKPVKGKEESGSVKPGVPDVKVSKSSTTIAKGECRIGLSKGATISMGNFQSARIDVWLERIVVDNEHEINKALEEISSFLDDALEEEQSKLQEEE